MRIIVLVKQILDPSGITIRRDKERMFINREEYIIGPGSLAAIEAGLRIRDTLAAEVEVIALSLGPPRVDDALREALAMGCDAGYRLTDVAFQDADASGKACIVAAAVQRLTGTDLIIAGCASGDTGSGQLGPRLAELLGYGQVTAAYALEVGDGQLLATRRWYDGFAQVAARLPTIVTVAPEAFPPRYPHGARIMNAYREWQVTDWDAHDLGLSGVNLKPMIASRGESYPPPLESGEQYRGEPAAVANDVVLTLQRQRLIEGAKHGL